MKLLSKESLGEGRDRRGKEEEREERRKGKREWQVTIIYLVATKKNSTWTTIWTSTSVMVTLASKVLTWRFPEGRRRELIDPYVHLSNRDLAPLTDTPKSYSRAIPNSRLILLAAWQNTRCKHSKTGGRNCLGMRQEWSGNEVDLTSCAYTYPSFLIVSAHPSCGAWTSPCAQSCVTSLPSETSADRRGGVGWWPTTSHH